MVTEARQNEAADKKRRELIDAKNTADTLVYQTEKALRDLGDKVPASERGDIEVKDQRTQVCRPDGGCPPHPEGK